MFTTKKLTKKYTEYEIAEDDHHSYFRVVPEAGGIITAFNVNGEDIIYLDRDRFDDGFDVRAGGVPVLFPICSGLTGGGYTYNGADYRMDFHGFARELPWKVTDINESTEGGITLELTETEETLKSYPFQFKVVLKYILRGSELHILQQYTNRSEREMPFYAGFHPYFTVSNKEQLKFNIHTDGYIDYASGGKLAEYGGAVDFTRPVDFVFVLKDRNGSTYEMTDPEKKRRIVIETAEIFKYMVMWTQEGRSFVCLEPWMAPPDAMNTARDVVKLGPGGTLHTWVKIRVMA